LESTATPMPSSFMDYRGYGSHIAESGETFPAEAA
jgi:hypothetical protein